MIKRLKKMLRNPKRGMSLVVVMVSVAMLVVMGTLFTSIALRSYNYSFSKLCKQQAHYTAQASVNALYDLIYDDEEAMNIIVETLDAKYVESVLSGVDDITAVYCTIGEVGGTGAIIEGDTGPSIIEDAGLFKDVMGTCRLQARYTNTRRTELSLEAYATYKGYSESVRMKIAKTTKAAEELSKIFSNAFCWSSPLTCMITAESLGDVYVAQPVIYAYDGNGIYYEGTSTNGGIYNTVLTSLEKFGYYGAYTGTAGQYIRNANDEIINDNSHAGVYNRYLRDTVYSGIETKVYNGDILETVTGHTKPFDIDNEPLAVEGQNLASATGEWYTNVSEILFYNDWVELYLFSDYRSENKNYGDIRSPEFDYVGQSQGSYANSFPQDYLAGAIEYPRNYTAINGDLYVQSRALIGLWDKDRNDKESWQFYYDTVMGRDYWDYYNTLGDTRFEHGYPAGVDVFFDHVNNNIPAEDTTFRINGNMYLWDDTRIENFDSINTYNAYQGIKNNIYARKDLAIDGYVFQRWNGSSRVHKKSVSIFGDIMVQGDLYIANSTIYGDVYCNGDNLTILDSTIYGNVYLRGNNFSIDNSVIKSGTLTFKDGNGLSINCPGGNLVIAGLKEDCVTESNALCTSYLNTNEYGAYIKNTSVTGTLYSKVNTKIIVAKWSGDDVYREIFGNIFVEEYLNIDLEYTNDAYINYLKTGASIENSQNNETALRYNTIDVTGNLVANKLRIKQSQHKTNAWSGLEAPHLNFNNVFVGTGGTYIDGNNWYGGFTLEGNRKSIYLDTLYTVGLSVWDTDYDLTVNPNVLGSWLSSFGATYSGAVLSQASDVVFAHQINNFATYGGVESIHFSAGQSLNLWSQYFFPTTWETKEANPQFWNAPVAAADETSPLGVYYYDINSYISNGDIRSGIQSYVAATGRTDVASVDNVNKVIEIKKSMVFTSRINFNYSGYIIKFNSFDDNLHLKFEKGVTFGENTTVVLTGGNMTFAYVSGGDGVEVPELKFGTNCTIGLVEEMTGVDRRSDSIYFISNDSIIIEMGYNMSMNGYIYAPNGFGDIVGSDGNRTILNGCMAVKNYLMQGQVDRFEETISEYKYCVYNHVPAPLITDVNFEFGNSEEEIGQFGEIIWEFLGYY